MNQYKIAITFTTDRKLSERELEVLLDACVVQVEEPADEFGEDVDFTTTILTVSTTA